MKQLSYSYPYSSPILQNVDLELDPGKFLGVLGHNGAGKTTLIDIITGVKNITSGEIKIFGENPFIKERLHKEKVIFLSQDVSIKGSLTIGEFLQFHSAFYPQYSKEDENYLLTAFLLKRSMKVGSLSTGQQKKVQIIAGLSSRPKLLIIDEITAVLDPETRDIFFRELASIKVKHETSIILATNIAEDLVERADSILFVSEQKAVLHSPSDIKKLFNIGEAA